MPALFNSILQAPAQGQTAAPPPLTDAQKALLEEANKLTSKNVTGGVTEAELRANPNMNAQQLANKHVTDYWSRESEAFSRVNAGMNNGTAKLIKNIGYDENGNPFPTFAITTGEHPGYDTLYLNPTGTPNVYSFTTRNQVAGGNISGIIGANFETGKYAPITNAAIQTGYTPGSPGGWIKNTLNDIGPVGNIALAIATGGLSIPEQLAAQTALNMAKGQDFEDSLKGAGLVVGGSQLAQGIAGVTGSPVSGMDLAADLGAGNTLTDIGAALNAGNAANAGLAGLAEGALPGATPGTVASDAGITALTPETTGAVTSPVSAGTVTETGLPSLNAPTEYTPELNVGTSAPTAPSGIETLPTTTPVSQVPEPTTVDSMRTTAQERDALDQWMKDYYASNPTPQPASTGVSGGETGGISELTGQGEGAFPGAQPGTVAMDQAPVGIETLPTTTPTIPGQGEGAFPGQEPGTVAMDQAPVGIETLPTTPTPTIPGQGEGAFPGTEPGTVAADQPIVPAAPSIPGQGEGAFPGTEPGTVATDNVPANGLPPASPGLLQQVANATGLPLGVVQTLATGLGLKAATSLLSPDQTPGSTSVGGPGPAFQLGENYEPYKYKPFAAGGIADLGGYSDGGRLLRGPGDGVSDSIPAMIGGRQPARLADGEFVIPARIVSEIGNGSTDAGARKLYEMMDRVQAARRKTTGKGRFATNTKADKYLPT